MTRKITLFDFMPYGAPELLQGSRPDLARALALGCALWCAVFGMAFGTGAFVPDRQVFKVPIPPPRINDPPPQFDPIPDSPPPPVPVPPSPPPPEDGRFEPLADAPDSVWQPPAPVGPVGETPPGQTITAESEGRGKQPRRDIGGIQPVIESYHADVMPEAVVAPRPEYPLFAKEVASEGLVVVRVVVGLEGRVTKAEILRSVPPLDAAALEAARRWVFTPALVDGEPMQVYVIIPFRFRLHE
ncbi:MAG TPA: energy transducer TonB [Candidatus Limnocylindria bacterium]|nr:energy transducer TonB [Candidatus Limnocylindria bacterium]